MIITTSVQNLLGECAYSIRLSLDRVRARGGKKGNFFVLFLTVILLHTLEFVDQTEQVVLFHFCVFLGSFAQISSVLSEQTKKHLARDLLTGCMHADPHFFLTDSDFFKSPFRIYFARLNLNLHISR